MPRSVSGRAVATMSARAFVVVAAALSTLNLLVVFDGLVVTVALPAIQDALGTTSSATSWVITAFAVPLGGTLLLAGRLGDRIGPRPCFAGGLVLFALGLLASGLAGTVPVLLAGRVLQGLGAGLALPNTFALASAIPAPGRRRAVFAASAVAGSSGSAVAAVIGGLLVDGLGWRSVFLVPVPVAVVTAAVLWTMLPGEGRDRGVSLPWTSSAWFVAAAAATVLTISAGSWPAAGVAVVALAGFVVTERRRRDPLLPRGVLAQRSLRGALLGMPGQVVAYNGIVYVGLLWFQAARGLSPWAAGLAFAPVGVGAIAGSRLAMVVLARIGWRGGAVAGLLVSAGALAVLGLVPDAPYLAVVLPVLTVLGAALALAVVTLNVAAGLDSTDGERGAAYGVFETTTHVSSALAVAALAVVLGAAATSADFVRAFLTQAGVTASFTLALVVYLRRSPS
ncbi:MFS transporter [Actinomycetospora succinea]|uniref:MFS transporter n=1 Tax=Actinomycetospora succinea TaxID=663603 RepID=A0A4R6VB74_9PSEU|nr:MFS transporter [Actinomycetospora succinea]TDQ53896.1 MFS transporter [Actinomycetospora succinea]